MARRAARLQEAELLESEEAAREVAREPARETAGKAKDKIRTWRRVFGFLQVLGRSRGSLEHVRGPNQEVCSS